MIDLKLIMDGDGAWPDLNEETRTIHDVQRGEIAMLPKGMSSGNTSVCFRLDIGEDETVMFQTSLSLLEMAVQAFRGREQYLREGGL